MGVIDAGRPGAFSAVAATGAYSRSHNRIIPIAAWLPLPVAVLVHADHTPDTIPIGIGIPRLTGGEVHVDAVLGSRSRRAWNRLCRHQVGVSVLGATRRDHTSEGGVRVVDDSVLVAVDLVAKPSDCDSRIKLHRSGRALSPEQRRVQQLFDEWQDEQCAGTGTQFLLSATIDGPAAMDELAPIVAPLAGLDVGVH